MLFLSCFIEFLIPLLYALISIFLLIFYASFKSILFFLVEDHFHLSFSHPIPKFMWYINPSVYEYGYMAGWLLFSTIGFLVCFVIAQKLCAVKENTALKKREKFLWLILLVSFLSLLFDILNITGNFLMGKTDSVSLIQTSVSFCLSSCVVAFATFDFKQKFLDKNYFGTIVIGFLFLFSVLGVGISIKMAPPAYIQKVRSDIKRFEFIDVEFKKLIQVYASHKNAVPDSIETLIRQPNVNKNSFIDPVTNKNYQYKKINNNSYEVKVEFETDFTQARRLVRNSEILNSLQKGDNNLKYFTRSNKSGKIQSVNRVMNNINIEIK